MLLIVRYNSGLKQQLNPALYDSNQLAHDRKSLASSGNYCHQFCKEKAPLQHKLNFKFVLTINCYCLSKDSPVDISNSDVLFSLNKERISK
jgi:hypothetical protein